MRIKVTNDILEEMKKLEDAGLPRRKIAEKLGCSIRTIRRHLGFKPIEQRACTKITPEMTARMSQLYREGVTKSELASRFNVRWTTVHFAIKRAQIEEEE